MLKPILSILLMTSALGSSNDVEKIISNNQLIMNDFSYVSTLDIKKRVKIAVIGDYIHPEEFESVKPNYNEIEMNDIDDDGNGYIDDFYGYDTTFGNGRLSTPVVSGHENGIVSIMDAVISKYNLTDSIDIIPINNYTATGRFDDLKFKNMADSIDYALARGAKIISISQGVSLYNKYSFMFIDDDYKKSLDYVKAAILRAKKQGAIILGAVSNDDSRDHFSEPEAPANLDHVISVANVTASGAMKSGYGKNIDIAYYGTDIFVWGGRCEDYVRTDKADCIKSQEAGGFEVVTGSSLSTPIVALSLAIVNATGAEIEMNELLETRIHNSCAKKINSKKNIISKCVFSPKNLTAKYVD